MFNAFHPVLDTVPDGFHGVCMSCDKCPGIAGTFHHRLDLSSSELKMLQLVGGRRYASRSHDFDKIRTTPDLLSHGSHAIRYPVAKAS